MFMDIGLSKIFMDTKCNKNVYGFDFNMSVSKSLWIYFYIKFIKNVHGLFDVENKIQMFI